MASTSSQTEAPLPPPRLSIVVLGGNGYVGSHVCQEALKTGLPVTSISRSGRPASLTDPWVSEVNWVTGDAAAPTTYSAHLESAMGVISCVGAFGSSDTMYQICGQANINAIQAAATAEVPRFAFISAHDFQLPGGLLKGYVEGKKDAEAELARSFPGRSAALRPGFIHGTRVVGGISVPLSAIGSPLAMALKYMPTQQLASVPLLGAGFVPPVSAKAVAKVAVRAVTEGDPQCVGTLSAWDIQELGGRP